MPYYDRLNTASYTSPSGRSFSFSYQAVTRRISHRIGSFEFPGINGTLHQDKGVDGEVYPLRLFFHGPDYDIESDAFFNATKESGRGTLIHPRYGRKVVQILRVEQREDLVEEGGQAIIEVDFQESLDREFPQLDQSLLSEVPLDSDNFQTSAIANYADQVKTSTLDQRNNLKQSMLSNTAIVQDAFSDFDNTESFTNAINTINNNIDSLVTDPGSFASLIVGAIRSTSDIDTGIDTKLEAFANLITSLVVGETRNEKLTAELIGTSNLIAASESIGLNLDNTSSIQRTESGKAIINIPEQGTGFTTRNETIAAVIYLKSQFSSLIYSLDDAQTYVRLSDAYIQSILNYNNLAVVIGKIISAGLAISFNLPSERVVILRADSSPILLAYEFYESIDDSALDFFIDTNQLTGNEILTVPRGKTVIYYA